MIRLAMAAMLLLALAPAIAQTVVSQGKITSLSVVTVPGHTYTWELYSDANVNFAATAGNCPLKSAKFIGGNSGPNVNVQWLETGIYFFKVTARDGANCAMNLKLGMIKVLPPSPEIKGIIAGAVVTGACQQVKLDASKSIGDITKYEWYVLDQGGALTQSTGITTEFLLSPSFTGSLPAQFRVRLKVTNSTGSNDSDTIAIKVDHSPVADVYVVGKVQKDGSLIVDGTLSKGTSLNYRWFTTEGKIIGPDNKPVVTLSGPGIYNLEVTDAYGCISSKVFKFPIELLQIMANPDYARTSWAQDTTIDVLANDVSSVNLLPGTVRIIEPPTRGKTKVQTNGRITYTPTGRSSGRDQFVYEVCDAANLCASTTVTIDIYDSGLKIPEAFSPNGDGLNDLLVFPGLENYPKSHIHVYTRSGQLVYQSDDYQNDWDGRTLRNALTSHELVPVGVYYYILELVGASRTVKGFIYIGY